MLLLFACTDENHGAKVPEDDTAVDSGVWTDTAPDTGGDSAIDSAEPRPGALDVCAASGTSLTEAWSGRVDGVDAPTRMAWHDGLLALVNDHRVVHVVELDEAKFAPSPVFSWEVFDRWPDLYFRDDGLLVVAGEYSLYGFWPREGETVGYQDPPKDEPIAAISPAPEGARAVSAAGIYAHDPEAFEGAIDVITAPFARPLVATGREGTAHSRGEAWVAGTDESGAPMLGYDDGTGGGYAIVTPFPSAFGDPVSVVLVPGDGVLVAGGPDGYGWFARVDGGGVLTAFAQYESPGISRLAVSEGSAYGWTSFDGMGVFATHLDAPDYRLLTEEDDVVDLVVDPVGEWLLTASGDGTLRRWACVVEG